MSTDILAIAARCPFMPVTDERPEGVTPERWRAALAFLGRTHHAESAPAPPANPMAALAAFEAPSPPSPELAAIFDEIIGPPADE